MAFRRLDRYIIEERVEKGLNDLKQADMRYITELKEAFNTQDTSFFLVGIKYRARDFKLTIGTLTTPEFICTITVEEVEAYGCVGAIKYLLEMLKKEIDDE